MHNLYDKYVPMRQIMVKHLPVPRLTEEIRLNLNIKNT